MNLKHGHDIIELNAVDIFNQQGNVTTVHNFSTTRDVIELDFLTLTKLSATPVLPASKFHIGANHPHGGAEQIFYNPHNGQLWVDFFSNVTHTEVKDELAVLFGPGHTHPSLTAGDIIVA